MFLRINQGNSLIKTLTLAGVIFASWTLPAKALVTLDSFEDSHNVDADNFPFPSTNTPSQEVDETVGNILGGERDITVEIPSGQKGTINSQAGSANTGNVNQLTVNATQNNQGAATLQYDGNDNSQTLNTAGLGNQDLTQNGANEGVAYLISNPSQNATIKITLYSDTNNGDGNFSSLEVTSISTAGLQFFPFTDFTTEGGTGADFASVSAAVLEISGTAAYDITLDEVRFQPEPVAVPWDSNTGMGLLALGGFMALRQFRRRK